MGVLTLHGLRSPKTSHYALCNISFLSSVPSFIDQVPDDDEAVNGYTSHGRDAGSRPPEIGDDEWSNPSPTYCFFTFLPRQPPVALFPDEQSLPKQFPGVPPLYGLSLSI